MLPEAKKLLAQFPALYGDFDDPINEPDIFRSYDANNLMGLYLAVFDLFAESVINDNDSQAYDLLDISKRNLYDDRQNWPSELSTAIIIGFFENFGRDEALWKNLNKWFTKEEYLEFRDAFKYLLEPDEKELLRSVYD